MHLSECECECESSMRGPANIDELALDIYRSPLTTGRMLHFTSMPAGTRWGLRQQEAKTQPPVIALIWEDWNPHVPFLTF